MKATEIVKKYGIKAVIRDFGHYFKDANVGTIEGLTHGNEHFEVDEGELKRLVKSHELVEYEGGLIGAKNVLFLKRALGLTPHADRLEQAIADVEACQ